MELLVLQQVSSHLNKWKRTWHRCKHNQTQIFLISHYSSAVTERWINKKEVNWKAFRWTHVVIYRINRIQSCKLRDWFLTIMPVTKPQWLAGSFFSFQPCSGEPQEPNLPRRCMWTCFDYAAVVDIKLGN